MTIVIKTVVSYKYSKENDLFLHGPLDTDSNQPIIKNHFEAGREI